MSNDKLKGEREVEVFRQFVAIAGWEIDHHSIRKHENELTPDIYFHFSSGKPYAVELVELLNNEEQSRLGWQGLTQSTLESAHEALSSEERQTFDLKYGHALIYFTFQERPSKAALRSLAADACRELLRLDDHFAGHLLSFESKNLHDHVTSITVSRGNFNGPVFSAENVMGVGDPVTRSLERKLKKKYVCDRPIDLVGYLESAAMHPPPIWQGPLLRLTANLSNLGAFRRIWVVDLKRKRIEYVSP